MKRLDSDIVGSILLQVVLIAVNAVFACAEIAVVSCNDAKLEKMAQEGNKRAAKLFHLTEQPSRFLATIQVVITLSGFLGSAFAAENFSDRIVSALVDAGMKIPEKTLDAIAVVLITLLLSYITLIFGELVPKRIAMQKAEQIALGISGLVSGASKVFAPLVWLLTASTNGILRLLGIDPDEDDDQVWKVNYGLKKSLTFKSKTRIGEPCCKEQRDQDLRNKSHNPHDHSVFKIDPDLSTLEEFDIIGKAYKVRSNLRQSRSVVFKEAVINCTNKRNELEYEIYYYKRYQEDISPFVIADRFMVIILCHYLPP